MTLDNIKKEIFRFLESDTPEVIAIKGAWGVGKTYSWNKLLTEAKDKNKISHNGYSYVSLFGVNSLDSFRYSIFEQLIDIKLIGTEPSLETLKENWKGVSVSLGKKLTKHALPHLNKFSPAVESILFLAVKDALICVDDFERKGALLTPKDALGVLSELKERKNCKIVLILNDESFEDPVLEKEYQKYKEKVIDIEILFDPQASESADIALNPDKIETEQLKQHITKLDLNNIRTIKRIERLSSILSNQLKAYEPSVLNHALHTLVLYSWCYYHEGKKIPTLEYIKNIGCRLPGVDDKGSSQLWQRILTDYGYQKTNEFDLVISSAVETGAIDETSLKLQAEKLNQQYIAAKFGSSFEEAWDLYHDCFDNNEADVLKKIYDSFKKNTKYIPPMKLDETVRLFRDLGKDKEADELIDHYITIRKDEKKLFDRGYYFASDINDKKIIEEFDKLYDEQKEHKTLKEVLTANSRGSNDIDVLANASVEDYCTLFKEEKGRHLGSWINACLRYGRAVNASEKDKKIEGSVTSALLKIAGESEINARRVAKFGIKIDEKK